MARLRPLTPDSTITFLLKPLPIDTSFLVTNFLLLLSCNSCSES